MDPPMITRAPVAVLAVLPGAAVVASVLPMAGCGRSAAFGAPVPASAVGRLIAIARRAAARDGGPRPEWITAVVATGARALAALPPRQRAALVFGTPMTGTRRRSRTCPGAAPARSRARSRAAWPTGIVAGDGHSALSSGPRSITSALSVRVVPDSPTGTGSARLLTGPQGARDINVLSAGFRFSQSVTAQR